MRAADSARRTATTVNCKRAHNGNNNGDEQQQGAMGIVETITAASESRRGRWQTSLSIHYRTANFFRSDVITLIRVLGRTVQGKDARSSGVFPFVSFRRSEPSWPRSEGGRQGGKEETHLRGVSDPAWRWRKCVVTLQVQVCSEYTFTCVKVLTYVCKFVSRVKITHCRA